MARIEWIKLRLNNWALWSARKTDGGSGFSSQAAFLRTAGSGYREAVVPVDDVDASVTDEAVESLRLTRPQLYRTLHCIYPKGMGIKGTARECGCGESTIKAHLEIADGVLALWFSDRSERAMAVRSAAKRSSAT